MSKPEPEADLKPAIKFLSWMTICYVAPFAVFEGTNQGLWFWYVSLIRPSLAPPTWMFTPVSTVLYGLMGIAAWQISREPPERAKNVAMTFFFVQLILGALWFWIFFGWQKAAIGAWFGLVEVLFLVLTTIAFWKLRASAGRLLLPTLLWAFYLTFIEMAMWRLNR